MAPLQVLHAVLFLLALLLSHSAWAGSYPAARKQEQVDDYHGMKVADPYRWLEDVDSPETRAWVQEENRLTADYLKRLPGRDALRARLTELWNYPKFGLPFKEGGRTFYSKNTGLQNQAVLYVQDAADASPDASRVLLDPNTLSADGTVALSGASVSDDGNLLAYSLSGAGSDWQEFHVRGVADSKDHTEVLKWVKFTHPSWTKDNRGFFYSRFPEPDEKDALRHANRNHKIYYHAVGTPQSQDPLVFERPDQPRWLMGAQVSEDGRYAVVSISEDSTKNRIYYIDLHDGAKPTVNGQAIKLIDVFEAEYDFIGNDGPLFYFRTDFDAPRGRIIAIDTTQPDRAHWKTIVPQSDDAIEGVTLIGDQFVVSYLHNAYARLAAFDLGGKNIREIELPGLGTVAGISGRRKDKELFYAFTSFLQPPTSFRYNPVSGKSTVFRANQAKFDPSPYETHQVFGASKDGTKVPIFVTHRKGLKLDGSHPTFLTGYGGFKIPILPSFSIPNAVWLENGGVLAVVNLRGGGEFGEAWHEDGMLQNKQHVFDDFIAAAEFLQQAGYTSPKKLAISGRSNGGLLIGAVLNQRPDLFGAAIPGVGVMDMLRFQKFTIGSAWVGEYGSSDNAEQFKTLYAYSPLHNIKPGATYPPTMVITADHDDRVVPGHSFKYAATLQAAQAGPAPILIRIETRAGHGAGKPTAKIIEEATDEWAFIMHELGMDNTVAGSSNSR